jgi:cobalamin synthase
MLVPALCLIATALAFYLKHKLGGLTGDSYGAINEVAEIAALLLPTLVYNVFTA